jgi:hypothetical protein
MSDTELRAEIERLTTLNDRLARQVIGMAGKLEAGRRELLATGWDAAVTEADRRWQIGAGSAATLNAENPYRKPVIDFSGAIACKVDEG